MADVYSLCMQRSQEDRPTVSEILSLDPVRFQASKLGMNLGRRGKAKTLEQLIQEKKAAR